MEKYTSRQMGDVFLSSPLSFWSITILVTIIILGLLILVILGDYSRKERVEGLLIPSKGLVRIIPPNDKSFSEIYVSTGDYVEIGTPLIKMQDNTILEDGHQVAATLLEQMEREKINLEKQYTELPLQFSLKRKRLETQKIELQSEADRFVDQIEIQKRAVQLEENIFIKMSGLRKDEAASELEASTAESRFLTASQKLNMLVNTREKILSAIKDVDALLELLPVEQSDSLAQIESRRISLEQNITRTDAGGSLIVSSPVAGIIAAITARKGQYATKKKSAISILPTGGKLQAELYVPTRAIGFVNEGQPVRLLYDAFPYQKFGVQHGKIAEISKTVVHNTDLEFGAGINEPVFLVTVNLDQQDFSISGELIPLQAGMALSADIILEDRKIWEWAFEPVLSAVN